MKVVNMLEIFKLLIQVQLFLRILKKIEEKIVEKHGVISQKSKVSEKNLSSTPQKRNLSKNKEQQVIILIRNKIKLQNLISKFLNKIVIQEVRLKPKLTHNPNSTSKIKHNMMLSYQMETHKTKSYQTKKVRRLSM